MFKLRKFEIHNFRSITKTDSISLDQSCVIVGVNEAGKSNALLALCRTNPANSENVISTKDDVPRTLYNEYEGQGFHRDFCLAEYEADADEAGVLQKEYPLGPISFTGIRVRSFFDGSREFSFVNWKVGPLSDQTLDGLGGKRYSGFAPELPGVASERIQQRIEAIRMEAKGQPPPETELLASIPALERHLAHAQEWEVAAPSKAVENVLGPRLPKFIYFSKYGALESSVHLNIFSQNVQNRAQLNKQDKERLRTIEALFQFTGLNVEDLRQKGTTGVQQDKDLRQIKLNSASTKLSNAFNDWWKQHETTYRFTFTLDGDYFRIWVEDSRSNTPIELENRSAGLQWFLGFFVTFLVESEDAHRNAILLLDEPGMTLHPTAQTDLISFFKNLSVRNQLLFTTHSPFLIDHQNLENVVAAYLTEKGETKFTRDLGEAGRKTTKKKSVYPVHAALGLSVANTFLADSSPVFVEGVSDQTLLSGFLAALRRENYFAKTDPIFLPFGGVSSLSPMLNILSATGEKLLPVILDADSAGNQKASDLRNGLYQNSKDRIIQISKFTAKKDAEVEDLIPLSLFNDVALTFMEKYGEGAKYVPLQDSSKSYVQHFSHQYPGDWKVEFAGMVKTRLRSGSVKLDAATQAVWCTVFAEIGIDLTKV